MVLLVVGEVVVVLLLMLLRVEFPSCPGPFHPSVPLWEWHSEKEGREVPHKPRARGEFPTPGIGGEECACPPDTITEGGG